MFATLCTNIVHSSSQVLLFNFELMYDCTSMYSSATLHEYSNVLTQLMNILLALLIEAFSENERRVNAGGTEVSRSQLYIAGVKLIHAVKHCFAFCRRCKWSTNPAESGAYQPNLTIQCFNDST